MTKEILVTGDTHGSIRELISLIEKLKQAGKLDGIIHLGDYVEDAEELALIYPEIPLTMVAGNNDWRRRDVPLKRVVGLAGHRLLLIHGHKYRGWPKGKKMIEDAKKNNCDIVLFGHSHRYLVEEDQGVWRINPGSPTRPRGDLIPSALLLTLKENAPPMTQRLVMEGY